MTTALAVVAFISTVGGGIWYLGKPPYANEKWAADQIAGLQLQYSVGREDTIERRIFEMEVEKRRMGKNWPDFAERELQRLKTERERVRQEIRKYTK